MLRAFFALFTIALAIGFTVCGLMGIVPIYISAIVVFILKVAGWLLPIFDDGEEDDVSRYYQERESASEHEPETDLKPETKPENERRVRYVD